MKGLLFDCDGVLVDTEKDGHRVAFNRTFARKNFDVVWTVKEYGDLVKVSGGKERMKTYFNTHGWPAGVEGNQKDVFIKELHAIKTNFFMRIIASGELDVRPGILRVIDEAIKRKVAVAVCSTSNEKAVRTIVERLLGPTRSGFFSIFAGDMVSRKKPDPEIYNLALDRMDLPAGECLVVEDSRNGLVAAHQAGIPVIITRSTYTVEEDFTEAEFVCNNLDQGENGGLVDFDVLENIVAAKKV